MDDNKTKTTKKKRDKSHINLNVPVPTEQFGIDIFSSDKQVRNIAFLDLMESSMPELPLEYVEKMIDRRSVELTQEAVYRMMGGLQGEYAWAKANPTEFYKLRAKRLPQEKGATAQATQIIIQTPFDKNELAEVTITERKQWDGEDLDD